MNTAALPRPGSTRHQVPVVLRSEQDLAAYSARPPWRWLGSPRAIELDLPGLATPARQRLQRRLNFWRTVCGCLPGGLAVLAALVWRGLAVAQSPVWAPAMIALELGYVFLLGMAAKFVAVLAARIILMVEIARLRRRLRAGGGGPGEKSA